MLVLLEKERDRESVRERYGDMERARTVVVFYCRFTVIVGITHLPFSSNLPR